MDGMGEVNTPWRWALHRLRRAEIGSWLEVAIAMAQVVERKHGTDFAAKTVLDDVGRRVMPGAERKAMTSGRR
jgi:hypothetical protein